MSGARRARSGASREGSERTCVVGATALGGTALGATARGAMPASSERPAGATVVVAQHASGEHEHEDGEVGSVSGAETVVEPEPEPEQ